MNYGSFTRTDELGNQLGTFSSNELAVSLSYSNMFEEHLSYGVNAKFIYSGIAEFSSTALAADFGILFTIPDERINLGISLRNIGTQLSKYVSTRESLPADLTIGGSVVPKGMPLLLNLGFHKLNEDAGSFSSRFKSFSVGGEFTISRVIQARIGYNNEQRQDLKTGTSAGLAGFSGGIGITVKEYKLDYALSSLGSIGSLHRITIGTTF
jgi:hypothetical protein